MAVLPTGPGQSTHSTGSCHPSSNCTCTSTGHSWTDTTSDHETTCGAVSWDTVSKKTVPQKVKFHLSAELLLIAVLDTVCHRPNTTTCHHHPWHNNSCLCLALAAQNKHITCKYNISAMLVDIRPQCNWPLQTAGAHSQNGKYAHQLSGDGGNHLLFPRSVHQSHP